MLPYLQSKEFIIYNFDFDFRLIIQTIVADEIDFYPDLKGVYLMKMYARFIGHWNPISKAYRYQKLPGSSHSALRDCHAALELLKYLAHEEYSIIPKDYVPSIEDTPPKPEPFIYAVIRFFLIAAIVMTLMVFLFFAACPA